jgi:hypothetical protein
MKHRRFPADAANHSAVTVLEAPLGGFIRDDDGAGTAKRVMLAFVAIVGYVAPNILNIVPFNGMVANAAPGKFAGLIAGHMIAPLRIFRIVPRNRHAAQGASGLHTLFETLGVVLFPLVDRPRLIKQLTAMITHEPFHLLKARGMKKTVSVGLVSGGDHLVAPVAFKTVGMEKPVVRSDILGVNGFAAVLAYNPWSLIRFFGF